MAALPAYDVVIAGGGYAGLAAAGVLGERALVIDQHEIGAIQHSACGTPLAVARHYGGDESVIQVYPDAFVHTPRGTLRYPIDRPYCIFDHQILCRRMFEQSGAGFLRARVQGLDGSVVQTSAGSVRAGALIDATGWPAALASARRPELKRPRELTIGIEAEIPGRQDGIHFYVDTRIVRAGYAWVFPAGDELRIGVASYHRQTDLKPSLQRFLDSLGLTGRPRRGGMIPWFRRPPVIEDIVLAGDAAGHCLPLTAEGIRFALHFGRLAGKTLRPVVDHGHDLHQVLPLYERAVRRQQRRSAALRVFQRLAGPTPDGLFYLLARLMATPTVRPRFQRAYGRFGLDWSLG